MTAYFYSMKRSQGLFAIVLSGLLLLVGYWWQQRYTSEADELQNQISRIQLESANSAMKTTLDYLDVMLKKEIFVSDSLESLRTFKQKRSSLDEYPESKSVIMLTHEKSTSLNMQMPKGVKIDSTSAEQYPLKINVGMDSSDQNAVDTFIRLEIDESVFPQVSNDKQQRVKKFGDSIGIDIIILDTEEVEISESDTLGKWYWASMNSKVREDPYANVVFMAKNNFTILEHYQHYLIRQIWPELLAGALLLLGMFFFNWLVRQDMKRQQHRITEKDRFIANVAHELKTPIATVSVSLEALEDFGVDTLPERRKEYISIARHEVERLKVLADRALSSMQLENGALKPLMESVDLVPIIENAWSGLVVKHSLLKNQLCYFVSQNNMTNEVASMDFKKMSLPVKGDPDLFQHLFYNLLDNACKYGGDPLEIQLTVSLGDTYQTITICDNGPGVPESDRKRIFERFYRVDDGTGHRVKGHGLGLAYARQIAVAHGGNLWLDTDFQAGACFKVMLNR